MSLRPRQDFAGRVSIAQSRMAPGGRRWSESPIPRPARRRVRQVGQAVEEPLPPFWWKFDEASGAFASSGTSAGSISGGTSARLQPPLAPGSTYSFATTGMWEGWDFPAVDPGPGGWLVFDWWMAGQDMTLDGRQVWVMLVRFRSAAGTGNDLKLYWAGLDPDPMVKTLRFCVGSTATSAEVISSTVLALTAWPNPGRFRWKVNPAANTWQIWVGDTLAGSGSHAFDWSGLWEARLDCLDAAVPAGWDEFKVYGE